MIIAIFEWGITMPSSSGKPKCLYRSRDNAKIAGVCGGLGEYFEVDPVWVRLLFVLFLFAGGSAFIVYLVFWLIVPLEPIGR